MKINSVAGKPQRKVESILQASSHRSKERVYKEECGVECREPNYVFYTKSVQAIKLAYAIKIKEKSITFGQVRELTKEKYEKWYQVYVSILKSLLDLKNTEMIRNPKRMKERMLKAIYWLYVAHRTQVTNEYGEPLKEIDVGFLELLLDEAIGSKTNKDVLREFTVEAMLINYQIADAYGCLSVDDDLGHMRHGNVPIIRRGEYKDQKLTVDHILPASQWKDLNRIVANLRLMPAQLNNQKANRFGTHEQQCVQWFFHHVGLIDNLLDPDVEQSIVQFLNEETQSEEHQLTLVPFIRNHTHSLFEEVAVGMSVVGKHNRSHKVREKQDSELEEEQRLAEEHESTKAENLALKQRLREQETVLEHWKQRTIRAEADTETLKRKKSALGWELAAQEFNVLCWKQRAIKAEADKETLLNVLEKVKDDVQDIGREVSTALKSHQKRVQAIFTSPGTLFLLLIAALVRSTRDLPATTEANVEVAPRERRSFCLIS